jgi:hypothetical protein
LLLLSLVSTNLSDCMVLQSLPASGGSAPTSPLASGPLKSVPIDLLDGAGAGAGAGAGSAFGSETAASSASASAAAAVRGQTKPKRSGKQKGCSKKSKKS